DNENMAAIAHRLSLAEFQAKYGLSDVAYEYWHGEAIPKGMPSSVHGFLQAILMRLLEEAGYKAGGDVELRIEPDAHPRPDIIATKGKAETPYPTKAVEIVVEILSSDDPMFHLLQKCSAYHEWGFEFIYVVDPEGRQIYRWTGKALETVTELVSIPAVRIWDELDQAIQ
ncbi:MAG: Uma2 family endonuclease, partial [Bryobacteraceae bacterium]